MPRVTADTYSASYYILQIEKETEACQACQPKAAVRRGPEGFAVPALHAQGSSASSSVHWD